MATTKKKHPARPADEIRPEQLEGGSELFVAVAYHYARWDDINGKIEILDEDDCDEVVVGVFTSERLYRIGVESVPCWLRVDWKTPMELMGPFPPSSGLNSSK